MSSNLIISVVGNIGSGKSTFIKYLNSKFSANVFYEDPKNYLFLEDSFENPKRWSFHNQLDFILVKKNELSIGDNLNQLIINEMDFEATHKIWTPVLKELNYITEKEELLINKTYKALSQKKSQKKIIYIYLFTNTKITIERIVKRNRDFEDVKKMSNLVYLLHTKISEYTSNKVNCFVFNNCFDTFEESIEKNRKGLYQFLEKNKK